MRTVAAIRCVGLVMVLCAAACGSDGAPPGSAIAPPDDVGTDAEVAASGEATASTIAPIDAAPTGWWDIDRKERVAERAGMENEPGLAFSIDRPVDAAGDPEDVSVFFVDDRVVILTPDAVTARTATGDVVWVFEDDRIYDNLVAAGSTIVVDGSFGAVALDASSGALLTEVDSGVNLNPIGFVDGGVWGTNASGDFTAVDPVQGVELWRVDTDTGALDFSSRVTATTFETDQDFDEPLRLRWFDIDTGDVLHDPAPEVTQVAIAIGDDEVCGASEAGDDGAPSVLSCFDLESGMLRWQVDLDVSAEYGTLVAVNEDLIAHTPDGGPVVVFDATTGEVAWSEDDGTAANDENPFIESAPGLVVTTGEVGELYARDVQTGELRWSVPDVDGIVIPGGEVVHVVDGGVGGFRTFDTNGNELWTLDADGDLVWVALADDGTGLALADRSTIRVFVSG